MTGEGESTKPATDTDAESDETPVTADSPDKGEAQVREPRDTSGDMIAVEVEEPVEEESPKGGEAAEAESEPEAEPDPVAELTAELDKKQNQLLRVAADYDNYKKRARRDSREAGFRARNELLQELLPVIDNVELALSHAAEGSAGEADIESLRKGVQMVLKQFNTAMEKYEVKAFDSLGEPFDPNFHEALQQRETDEYPPGAVVEEYRRGYLMGDRLIRPAMVVVAAAPAGDKSTDADPEDSAEENGNEG